MIHLIEIIIGLASGLIVGGGLVAFLTVLGIIPRLTQLSKTAQFIRQYEAAVVLGAIFGIYLSFTTGIFHVSTLVVVVWGGFHGIFVGMLAAALTEVLNVFPLLAKRIRLEKHLLLFMMAIVLGKICGSLFQWVIFVK